MLRRARSAIPRWSALAVAMTALGACSLLTSKTDFELHCAFAGRDTDCGQCLVARCQARVDACCGDGWCDGLIGLVEGCAQSQDERCDAAHAAAGELGARGALATCMEELCRGACERAPASSSTHCAETKFGVGTACTCEPATSGLRANRYQCGAGKFPNARCCAPPTWPNPGNACSCLAVACGPTSDGCLCFLSDSYSPSARTECRGGVCCRTTQSCRCGASPCETSEEQVESCDVGTVPCPLGSQTVSACSLP